MLTVVNCLSSCTATNYNFCPQYPIAGLKTAIELEQIEYESAPYFWEWMGRINKLRQELEICN